MKIWVEVDTKHKRLKKRIYHFKPDNVPVVEVELGEGELFDFSKYTVEKDKSGYKLKKKSKGGK